MTPSRPLVLLAAVLSLDCLIVEPTWAQAPPPVPGAVATTNNPNLAVASVKLESGARLGKLIGAGVYIDPDEKLGVVDDLIMADGNKVTVAIIAIGGVLGLGSKLVALPFEELKRDGDKIMLVGVTKDALTAMPNFVY